MSVWIDYLHENISHPLKAILRIEIGTKVQPWVEEVTVHILLEGKFTFVAKIAYMKAWEIMQHSYIEGCVLNSMALIT